MAMLFAINIYAQKVYVTKYRSQATQRIYVTNLKSEAGRIVKVTDLKSQAKNGKWCFIRLKSEADMVIYYVRRKSDATLVVCFQ